MGCDIHAYIEYDDYGDFKYDMWAKLHLMRHYLLFSVLADVRNGGEIEAVSQPKGLPGNLSWGVKDEYDNRGDGHSESFLHIGEVEEALDRIRKTEWGSDDLEIIYKIMKELKNPRLVFWFDS